MEEEELEAPPTRVYRKKNNKDLDESSLSELNRSTNKDSQAVREEDSDGDVFYDCKSY
jgi:hypothetical protein